MFNLICDIIGTFLFAIFLIWAIKTNIKIYRIEKYIKRRYPPIKYTPYPLEIRGKFVLKHNPS